MKALISQNEKFNINYISSWELEGEEYIATYSTIEDCIRIAEVRPDDETFDVAPGLFWVDCPDECDPSWYFKNNMVYSRPENEPKPI